jgi:type II secretory pathway pseudopilin PulG
MKKTGKNKRQAGFSILELLIVIGMSITITAIAIPRYFTITAYLRASGDLRSLGGLLAQAKMRAASGFTHARVYADLTNNVYQLQVWNKTANAGAGCWVADADSTNTCLTYGGGQPSGSVFPLAQGDTFGFNGLATGPTPGQAAIAQAAGCLNNANAAVGGNTACIVFNSRGVPIDATTLAPIATGAFYLTNGVVVDGVTISATGSIQSWSSPKSSASWHAL